MTSSRLFVLMNGLDSDMSRKIHPATCSGIEADLRVRPFRQGVGRGSVVLEDRAGAKRGAPPQRSMVLGKILFKIDGFMATSKRLCRWFSGSDNSTARRIKVYHKPPPHPSPLLPWGEGAIDPTLLLRAW